MSIDGVVGDVKNFMESNRGWVFVSVGLVGLSIADTASTHYLYTSLFEKATQLVVTSFPDTDIAYLQTLIDTTHSYINEQFGKEGIELIIPTKLIIRELGYEGLYFFKIGIPTFMTLLTKKREKWRFPLLLPISIYALAVANNLYNLYILNSWNFE